MMRHDGRDTHYSAVGRVRRAIALRAADAMAPPEKTDGPHIQVALPVGDISKRHVSICQPRTYTVPLLAAICALRLPLSRLRFLLCFPKLLDPMLREFVV